MQNSKVIAAVDQGGTKTSALIEVNGNIYEGRAGGACCFYTGYETAAERFFEAIEAACLKAGTEVKEIECIGGGISGLNYPEETEKYTAQVKAGLKARGGNAAVRLLNDCESALYSEGCHSGASAVMAVGTEFNAAIKPEGKPVFLYGNYITERDLGGKAIGNEAVEAVILASVNAEKPTVLSEILPELFGCETPDGLRTAYRRSLLPLPLSTAAKEVFDAAKEGDSVSDGIIREFARRISRYIKGGIKSFGLEGSDLKLLLTGGIVKNRYKPFEEVITDEIRSVCRNATVITAAHEPVYGALYTAENLYREI